MTTEITIEIHPWTPYIPNDARVLILGTFPPGKHRWAMDFYYPNPTNDFWRIIGIIFFNDKDYFYNRTAKRFDDNAIKQFISSKKIAVGDTALEVKRLKNNASDKHLEIVTPINLSEIISNNPTCNTIVSTGEKAAQTIASLTSTTTPAIGEFITYDFTSTRTINIYRMPSSSRAYPLSIEKKAEFYGKMFHEIGIF